MDAGCFGRPIAVVFRRVDFPKFVAQFGVLPAPMTALYSDLPRHVGERQLARVIQDLSDPRIHLWCSIDYLPGVGDIDILLWHESSGVFLIEVKAIPMDAIEDLDFKNIKIMGRPRSSSPHYQAHQTERNLRGYLTGRGVTNRPFVTSSACFPRIQRAEWNARVADHRLRGEFSDSLLFSDDLKSAAALETRLRVIARCPPVGRPSQRFKHDPNKLRSLVDELSVLTDRAIPSDDRRVAVLERPHRESADADAPADKTTRIVYTGHPGTGKTFRLLRIGIQHALSQKRVLFLCFNKVLGADVRRLVSASKGKFESYDLFEFLTRLCEFNNVSTHKRPTADEWARSVLDELGDDLPVYDTVLVDEAQDLKPWAVDLVSRVTHDQSSIVAAHSKGQELYGNADELARLSLEPKELRRVFRNSRAIFRYAQAFYEADLLPERLDRFFARFDGSSHENMLFEGEGGNPPQIHRWVEAENARSPKFRTALVDRLKAVVTNIGVQGGTPHDLLVLVPKSGSSEFDAAKAALKLADMKYIDLVVDENRRSVAPRDRVRVSTFHSARGIEARHTIVLGLTALPSIEVDTSLKNLAYIALSRATASSDIVLTASDLAHPIGEFAILVSQRLSGADERSEHGLPPERRRSAGRRKSDGLTIIKRELQLRPGDRVVHDVLGRGHVVRVLNGENPVAEVLFQNSDTRVVELSDILLNRE